MATDKDTRKENNRPPDQLIRLGKSVLSAVRRLREWLRPRRFLVLFVFLAGVFVLLTTMLILDYTQGIREAKALKKLAMADEDSMPSSAPIVTPATSPAPILEAPVILPNYQELYSQNRDMAGWVKIDGTPIDYPVMYSTDDFYLSHNFNREESKSGVPFIDKRCTVEPLGTNTIIYGHHMKDGTMFTGLIRYEVEAYHAKHPTIRFDTLYTQQEYSIIAVFRSQIYKKSDAVFKYYNFLNAEDKEDFEEFIADIKALSLYETGVTAEYGDTLITLVTCAYHTENGQFVVVAKCG